MLDTLKNSLLITSPITLKLQQIFNQTVSAEIPKQQPLINQLIESIYIPTIERQTTEDMLALFFIIPKTIEGLSSGACLTFFHAIIFPLVEQLPWVKKSLWLNIQKQTCAEQALHIDQYINQYGKFSDETARDLLEKFYFKEGVIIHVEATSFTYRNTIIAYSSLTIIRLTLLERFPEKQELIAQVNRAIETCDLFLSSNAWSMDLEGKHKIIGALSNIFLFESVEDPAFAIPTYLQQTQDLFKKLSHYKLIKHCITLQTVDFFLSATEEYKDIEPLFFQLANDPDKPLIHMMKYNTPMLVLLTQYVLKTFRNAQTITEKLMPLIIGLKPNTKMPLDEENFEQFKFMLILYKDYVATNRGRYQKEGVLALLINVFLEEEGHASSPYISSFQELAFGSDHFGFALAFCLSTIDILPTAQKKEVFQELMKSSDLSLGIYLNWWNMMQNTKVPREVELQLFALFMRYTDDRCFNNDKQFNNILSCLSNLLKEYHQIPNEDLLEKTRVRTKISHFSFTLISVIERTKDSNLPLLMKTLTNSHESTHQVLLLVLIKSEPLSSIFIQLFAHKKIMALEKDKNHPVHYEADYLIQVTSELSQLDFKKVSPAVMDAVLSKEQAPLKALLLLLLLVFLSRNISHGPIPKQSKWFKWILSLIKEVTLNHSQTDIGKHMFSFIKSLAIQTFLPREERSQFLETIQPQAPLEPMISVEELMKAFEEEPKAKKHKKKPAQKPIETHKEASIVAPSRPLSETPSQEKMPLPPVEARESKPMRLSPEALKKPLIDEGKLYFDLFRKAVQLNLEQINKQLEKTSLIKLPAGFKEVYGTVQHSVKSIQSQLALRHLRDEVVQTIEFKATYSSLEEAPKLELEAEWNKELAIFCQNIRAQVENYLKTAPKESDFKFKATIDGIQAELVSLSHCYFKNPILHLPENINRCLSVIRKHYKSGNTRVAMSGNFAFPKEANDIDLTIIQERPLKDGEINDIFSSLSAALTKKYGEAVISGQIFQNAEVISYQVEIIMPSAPNIKIDFNFWKTPLSSAEELEKTTRAFLSTCAIHWYLDGHACMKDKTAALICIDQPVLGLLSPITTIEEYMHISGYILKNIIKYGDILSLDHHIQQFIRDYINPASRDAGLPIMLCGDKVEKNQIIIASAIDYLLIRLSSRTTKTIRYLMEQELLFVLFPFHEQEYALCANYFTTHFHPVDQDQFPSNLSRHAFLSMFFIGALIEQPLKKQLLFIEKLKKPVDFHQKILKDTLIKTIAILEALIPLTSDFLSIQQRDATPLLHKTPLIREAIKLIMNLWHLKGLPPQEKPKSPHFDVPKDPEVREKTPSPTSSGATGLTSYPARFLCPARELPEIALLPTNTQLGFD